jgi:leader peptidase (prepilin peptidase)/N-methyltransferase
MGDLYSWLWPVAAGPFVGSFLGVVVTRAESPRTIVFGRSACTACGARLGPLDLVPIASWLALRGRCRHCRGPIGWFHPSIEVAATAIAVWATSVASGPALWFGIVLGWALLALAVIDFRLYLLPDYLTLPLIPLGLAGTWLIDPDQIGAQAIGAISGLVFVIAIRAAYLYLRGREGIGLGDAKLLGAAGAWVGWQGLPSTLLLAAVSALVFAIGRSFPRGRPAKDERVPFGAFLGLGLWLVWLYGPLEF